MIEQKLEKSMTVNELAQITNHAFGNLEKDLDEKFGGLEKKLKEKFEAIDENFIALRREFKLDLYETEQRLLHVLKRIETKLPRFETLKNGVDKLSLRVGILEEKSR